ncbi:MAG: hypothetical protein JWR88_2159 [Pseudonocardia sp.]|jgi:hypothetical protein|nr:hypothetical protein [Pseudonocardia sp.]
MSCGVGEPLACTPVSSVREMSSAGSWSIPPLFENLVDDASLLMPREGMPSVADVVARYLDGRGAPYGRLTGQLVTPVSRLPEVLVEVAAAAPNRPVELSLLVDTGLGALPKALSMVLSRSTVVTPRTVEAPAPPDVDATWLERVAEFVPDDVLAVVEPRRPLQGDTRAWLDAVRRVAEHGCTPKLRCGGPRPSDIPSDDEVADFLEVAGAAGRGCVTSLGLRHAVRPADTAGAPLARRAHGILNLLVASARVKSSGDVRSALRSTDGSALAKEIARLSTRAAKAVRAMLGRCAAGPTPVTAAELAGLGLL